MNVCNININSETNNDKNQISKHFIYTDLLKPDMVFFLDVSYDERRKRIEARAGDKKIPFWEEDDFQKTYNSVYREIAKREEFFVIDTGQNTVDMTVGIILNEIKKIKPAKGRRFFK
jgi:thymidylate kinase